VRDKLNTRLADLREEYDRGRQTLQGLEAQVISVRETMLRISGAIQVLEELAAGEEDGEDGRAPLVATA
jgi:prefoldin subunit 5